MRGFEHRGSCHCGALSARYVATVPMASWAVRTCQCSFCQAHGALYAADPRGSLLFEANDKPLVGRYRFGLGEADFLICRRCGVYLGAVYANAGQRVGILNLRTLRPFPVDLMAPAAMSYDDESPGERTARWAKRWTPLEQGSL